MRDTFAELLSRPDMKGQVVYPNAVNPGFGQEQNRIEKERQGEQDETRRFGIRLAGRHRLGRGGDFGAMRHYRGAVGG